MDRPQSRNWEGGSKEQIQFGAQNKLGNQSRDHTQLLSVQA